LDEVVVRPYVVERVSREGCLLLRQRGWVGGMDLEEQHWMGLSCLGYL
jgi:hypothetical protein